MARYFMENIRLAWLVWKEDAYPDIAQRAREENAVICWGEETVEQTDIPDILRLTASGSAAFYVFWNNCFSNASYYGHIKEGGIDP